MKGEGYDSCSVDGYFKELFCALMVEWENKHYA